MQRLSKSLGTLFSSKPASKPAASVASASISRKVSSQPSPAAKTASFSTAAPAAEQATHPAAMSVSTASFLETVKNRRSIYALSKDLGSVSKERVQELVKEAVQHVPSSFNSQSNRVVILFGAEHDKLWDITTEVLKAIVPAEQWEGTAGRLAGFRGGAGTVLFFEDQETVNTFQTKFPIYSDRFPVWAGHSTGILQFTVWTALEAEGLGANLQHYNPLIDDRVASEWKVPSSWKLAAQLVFGGKAGSPNEKTFIPIEEKLKVYGA